jgi:hypothetical protein
VSIIMHRIHNTSLLHSEYKKPRRLCNVNRTVLCLSELRSKIYASCLFVARVVKLFFVVSGVYCRMFNLLDAFFVFFQLLLVSSCSVVI